MKASLFVDMCAIQDEEKLATGLHEQKVKEGIIVKRRHPQ